MNPLIFLSYSSKDKLVADAICSRLENQGIRCWIAPRDVKPGSDYSNQIADALEEATMMVMVFSSDSNNSRHVKSEIDRAFSLGKIIIPFRVENVELDKGLAYYLAKTHWLDAVTKPLEQHIDRLAATIRQVSGIETLPSSPTQPLRLSATPVAAASKAPWIIAGIVVLLCALVTGGLLFFWLNQGKRQSLPVAVQSSQSAPAPTASVPMTSPSSSPSEVWETADRSSSGQPPDEDPFEGTWRITDAQTLSGVAYEGTVQITRSGPRYSVKWNSPASSAAGIALPVGNKLCVAYSGQDFGVVVYKIGGDGTLKGRWAGSTFSADDPDGLENATGGPQERVEGTYGVKGLNPDGTNYQGKLKIVKAGQTFQLEWDGFGRTIRGVGIKVGDGLFVATGEKTPLGVVSYAFEGTQAKGVWTLAGEDAVAKENLTK